MNEIVLVELMLCLVGCLMGGALVYMMFELRFGKLERKFKKRLKKQKDVHDGEH